MGTGGHLNYADIEMETSAELSKLTASLYQRSSISDMVQDESEHIQVTRIKIVEVQAKEKTAREKLKHQSLTGIEHKHLQFQHEEDGLYFIFMRPFWLLFVVASIQVVS